MNKLYMECVPIIERIIKKLERLIYGDHNYGARAKATRGQPLAP